MLKANSLAALNKILGKDFKTDDSIVKYMTASNNKTDVALAIFETKEPVILDILTMPSNKIVIASAGAGKTTEIVREALALCPKKSAVVTFTLNNVEEIRSKFFEINGCVPPEVTVYPWFTFMLHEMARPYQGIVHVPRITSVHLINGASTQYIKKADIKKYYFNKSNEIYSDKLSDFRSFCEKESGGAVLNRLKDMYAHILIDEVQDLAGFDIDILEALLSSPIEITLVGDIRQSTFRTNYSHKNKGFVGRGLLNKIDGWEKKGLCKLSYLT